MQQAQPYDTTTKALFREEAAALIPLLFTGTALVRPLDGEVVPPTLRTDRAYKVHNEHGEYVLHFEYQASRDERIARRLLIYFGLLWDDHKIPVVCTVIYLFHTKLPDTPATVAVGGQELLRFHFQVIAMWQLDARIFVGRHDVCIYPLLPTMGHVDADLLFQAMEEMIHYYGVDSTKLSQRLLWFKVFLTRTDTVSKEEKKIVMEQVDIFEQLLEEDPWVQSKRALWEKIALRKGLQEGKQKGLIEGKQQGLIEGEQKGLIEGKQEVALHLIRLRYPALLDLAQRCVPRITTIETLGKVVDQMLVVTQEEEMRAILTPFAPPEEIVPSSEQAPS